MFHGDPEALRASPPPGSPPPTGPGTHADAVSVPAELAVLQTAIILGCPDCINAQADLLGAAPAFHVRQLGRWLMAATCAAVLVRIPISTLLSFDPVTQNGSIDLKLSSRDLVGFVCALVFLIISQALTSAHLAAQENKEFI